MILSLIAAIAYRTIFVKIRPGGLRWVGDTPLLALPFLPNKPGRFIVGGTPLLAEGCIADLFSLLSSILPPPLFEL